MVLFCRMSLYIRRMSSLRTYLPTPAKMGQEILATLGAIIISALIIRQIPALRALVKENTEIN